MYVNFFPKASLCHVGFSLVFVSRSIYSSICCAIGDFSSKSVDAVVVVGSVGGREVERESKVEGGEEGEEEGRRMKMTFFSPTPSLFFLTLPPPSRLSVLSSLGLGGGGGRKEVPRELSHSLARFSRSILSSSFLPLFSSD